MAVSKEQLEQRARRKRRRPVHYASASGSVITFWQFLIHGGLLGDFWAIAFLGCIIAYIWSRS